MKKLSMIFAVAALIFAYTTVTVSAQNAPTKAKTEKVSEQKAVKADNTKATNAASTDNAKAGCSDKAKSGCTEAQKAKCGSAEGKSGCCSSKAAAKPVPAPTKK
jgi:hypothetical protein